MPRQNQTTVKLSEDDILNILSALRGEGVNPPEMNDRLIKRLQRALDRV